MRASWIQYDVLPDTPQLYARQELVYTPRGKYQPLCFVPGALAASVSWVGGGLPFLTDVSFVLLIIACLLLLVDELMNFSRRFGLGAMVLYGGVLTWFCYDYMTTWFLYDFSSGSKYTAETISKSACLYQIFIFFAAVGLHLPMWGRLEKFLANIQEPRTSNVYLLLIVLAFVVGLLPYVFFAADSVPVALWKDMTGGRGGGAGFTVGRTGNVNTNWGAYLAQVQQVGQIGALLAIFYAIVMRPNIVITILCILYWLEQVALGFGTGTRGQTAFMIMPAMFLFFLKYQSQAAVKFKRISVKAYTLTGLVVLAMLVAVQVQIAGRNSGFTNVELSSVSTNLQGNSMFTEGLAGMALIPSDTHDFFYNSVPGEGVILVVPELAWRFIYGPIPRALWPGKPIDPVWAWYNAVVTGRGIDELEGTTISTGLVGDFYFRFGMAGLIEGGMIFGYFCLVGERMLLNSQGRLIQLMGSLGFLVFIFRAFRNLTFISLYPLLVGLIFLMAVNRILSPPNNLPTESQY